MPIWVRLKEVLLSLFKRGCYSTFITVFLMHYANIAGKLWKRGWEIKWIWIVCCYGMMGVITHDWFNLTLIAVTHQFNLFILLLLCVLFMIYFLSPFSNFSSLHPSYVIIMYNTHNRLYFIIHFLFNLFDYAFLFWNVGFFLFSFLYFLYI